MLEVGMLTASYTAINDALILSYIQYKVGRPTGQMFCHSFTFLGKRKEEETLKIKFWGIYHL